MKKWLISKIMGSKKFWYAVAAIVVPIIARQLDVDEATVQNMVYSIIALIVGQGVADFGKHKTK